MSKFKNAQRGFEYAQQGASKAGEFLSNFLRNPLLLGAGATAATVALVNAARDNSDNDNSNTQTPPATDTDTPIDDSPTVVVDPTSGVNMSEEQFRILLDTVKGPTLNNQPIEELRDPGEDKQLAGIYDLLDRTLDPEYRAVIGRFDLDQQKELARTNQQLALQKMAVQNARIIEKANIEAWRDMYKAQVEANAKIAGDTAKLVALSQMPNTGYMQAANEALKAGSQAGLQGF